MASAFDPSSPMGERRAAAVLLDRTPLSPTSNTECPAGCDPAGNQTHSLPVSELTLGKV